MTQSIFEPYVIKGKTVSNRLVAQAMEINSAEPGGGVGPKVLERYKQLAEGGWGIVFAEAISITEKHLARDKGLILNKKNLDGFKQLVDMFKDINEDTLFLFQLTHSGRQSGDFSQKIKAYEDNDKEIPVLSEQDLDEIQEMFMTAVSLASQAGADGVDIKSCHGYLGGELLRPLNNRHDSRYGGSAENRAFLASSVIKHAKEEFPQLITGSRISLFEGIRGGCGTPGPDDIIEDFQDMKEILSFFAASGADYINVSGGIPPQTPDITRPAKTGQFYRSAQFRYAKTVKEYFPNITIIGSAYTTGDDSSFSFANENIKKGYTDFAGFGRQNLADPLVPKKLIQAPDSIHYCQLCGGCSELLKKKNNVVCVKVG